MTIEIRRHPTSAIGPWYETLQTAFGEEARPDALEHLVRLFGDRLFAAMDGERIVGTAATITFDLTVPGGQLPAAGISAVGVLPTDRRRGVLTAMMRFQLEEARTASEPVAVLWASEAVIYQRFGYGLATLHGTIEVPRHRSAFRLAPPLEGRIRIVDRDEAKVLLPALFDRLLPHRSGFFSRSEAFWETEIFWDPDHRRHGASARRYAVYEIDGQVEGYAIHRVTPAWGSGGPEGTLDVREVMASTPRATSALWRFLLDHDLMIKLRARHQPPDPPLLLLVADPRALALTVGDGLWLRILDLPAALGARSYRGSGSLTLELRDPMFEDLAGRWRLEVTDGHGSASRTDSDPDLALGIDDLAAMYLGQWSASALALSGRVVARRDGALALADALFETSISPWCPQIF